MALALRKPVKPIRPTNPSNMGKPVTEEEPRTVKSVTVRMPPNTLAMLDAAVASYDSDRTEVIKRALRLLNACLSGHNASIVLTDRSGKERSITMVIDGVPT